MTASQISPCRPGHGASCALCCGSHNFAASHEEINALFDRRRDFYGDFSPGYLAALAFKSRSAMTGSYHVEEEDPLPGESIPKIFDDLPRCPYLAHAGDDGVVACVLFGDLSLDGRMECVRSYSGKRFRCGVHETLRNEEILYAAMLTGDWYYYGVLIHSAPILREIMAMHPSPGEVPPDRAALLRERLRGRF